jgi:hypothetical protein
MIDFAKAFRIAQQCEATIAAHAALNESRMRAFEAARELQTRALAGAPAAGQMPADKLAEMTREELQALGVRLDLFEAARQQRAHADAIWAQMEAGRSDLAGAQTLLARVKAHLNPEETPSNKITVRTKA